MPLGKMISWILPPKKIKIIYDFKKSIEFNLKKSHSPAFYSIDIGSSRKQTISYNERDLWIKSQKNHK